MAKSNNQYDFDDNSEYFARHKKKQRSEKLFWYTLFAACLGLIYFKFDVILNEIPSFPIVSSQIQPDLQNNNSTSSTTESCSATLPSDGGQVRSGLDNSAYDNSLPILEATNNYGSPVVLLIGNSNFSSYDRTITLHPGLNYAMHIPQGTYSLTLMVGQNWCNFDKGFLDGKRVKVSKPVEVIAGQTNKINVDGIGKNNEGIHVDIVHIATANSAPPIGNGAPDAMPPVNTILPIPQTTPSESHSPVASMEHEASNAARIEECYSIRNNATEVIEERMRHRYTSQEGEYFRKALRQIDDNYSACKRAAES